MQDWIILVIDRLTEAAKSLGPSAVIAIILVVWLTQSLSPAINNLTHSVMDLIDANHSVLNADVELRREDSNRWHILSDMKRQQHQDFEAGLQLQEQTCLNTAHGHPDDMERCRQRRNLAEQQQRENE